MICCSTVTTLLEFHRRVGEAARQLVGKEAGDEITVDAPRGRISYEVLSVRFLGVNARGGSA